MEIIQGKASKLMAIVRGKSECETVKLRPNLNMFIFINAYRTYENRN